MGTMGTSSAAARRSLLLQRCWFQRRLFLHARRRPLAFNAARIQRSDLVDPFVRRSGGPDLRERRLRRTTRAHPARCGHTDAVPSAQRSSQELERPHLGDRGLPDARRLGPPASRRIALGAARATGRPTHSRFPKLFANSPPSRRTPVIDSLVINQEEGGGGALSTANHFRIPYRQAICSSSIVREN